MDAKPEKTPTERRRKFPWWPHRQVLYGLAITGLAFFSGCQGETSPVIVTGASMFPAYPGEHYDLTCRECNFPFPIDANRVPRSGSAICPNCGFTKNSFRQLKVSACPEIRLSAKPASVDRWDVVAFHGEGKIAELPDQKWAIKRVVGLPGEEIEIRHGNIFANGELLSKPVSIQQQMLIPVFDSKYLPDKDQDLRLQSAGSGDSQKYTYRHIRGYRHHAQRYESCPIDDGYGYNQNVARSLNPVEEVLVKIDTYTFDSDLFRIRIRARHGTMDVACHPTQRQFEINIGSERMYSKLPDKSDMDSIKSFAVSNIDSCVRVFADDALVFESPIRNTGRSTAEKEFQIELELGKNGLSDKRVSIFRDVYYLSGNESATVSASKWKLEADQFFLLGDNSPVSIDSRKYGSIGKLAIVGRLEPDR